MKIINNEETAEMVGLCFGDGSLLKRATGKDQGKLRFQLRGNITEDKAHYDSYVKPLFEKYVGPVSKAEYTGKNKYYGIVSERQYICSYLADLGVPVGRKRELQIPQWIRSNRDFLKGFIRGFVDTDGSVFCGKDYNYPNKGHIKIRMSIVSISENLIDELSEGLQLLGIHNIKIKRYQQKTTSWSNFSKIQIDGPNVVDYFHIVGTHNLKLLSKFAVWRESGSCPPYTTLKERQEMLNLIPINARVAEPGQMRNFATAERRVEGLVS